MEPEHRHTSARRPQRSLPVSKRQKIQILLRRGGIGGGGSLGGGGAEHSFTQSEPDVQTDHEFDCSTPSASCSTASRACKATSVLSASSRRSNAGHSRVKPSLAMTWAASAIWFGVSASSACRNQ